MSKIAKKLLSVVLAVLVLAAGFSTMLGTLVLAEPEWTYDYQTLIPEFVGTNRDHELLKHKIEVSDGSKLVPEQLGFYDFVSIATNARVGGGGLWGEGVDGKGNPSTVTTDTMGLRVTDTFFLNAQENRWYVTNRENIDDARAYVTYEVNAGSEFRVQYLTYTEAQWAKMNLSVKDFYFLEILVSTDGVNWVPAKVENDVVNGATAEGNYDRVTATVANVGAATRFVKVQFPANPHTVTYTMNNGQWVKNYYPQDAWFINKVALDKPATANNTETVVNFTDVDTDGTTVITTVNGVKTDPANVFGSYGKLAQKACGLVAYGDNLWKIAEWQNKYRWGAISESEREFFLGVQPGTRFNLTFTDYNSHDDVAKGLVGAGNIETTDDFAVKVFTAASTDDFAKGTATEHKMVPALQNGGNGFFGTYNFIIPEGHTFVRILHPVSGAIGSVMKLKEDGTPMDYAQENAIINTAGNDWVHIKGIIYTAPVFAVTDDYKANGWNNAHGEYYYNLNSVSGKQGLAQPANTGGKPANVIPTADDATNTARTDAELAYAVYNVQPGTLFSANLYIRWGNNDWGKSKYDAVATAAGLEEFYFEILGSKDGITYETITTLGKTGDAYVKSTAKDNYDVGFSVPANVKYVKILSHFRGGYKSGNNWCVHDDNFAIKSVSFTPYVEEGTVTKDYSTPATGVADNENALSSGTIANAEFNAEIGTVAAGQSLRLFQSGSNNNTVTKGLGIAYADRTDATRAYAVYAVKPGTKFAFHYYINTNNKKKSEDVNKRPFEFLISSASSLAGTFTRFAQTDTKKTESTLYSFIVPEGANFIKIEWPQSSGVIKVDGSDYWLNHDAFLRDVTFVPYEDNSVKYNYKLSGGISTETQVNRWDNADEFTKKIGAYATGNRLFIQDQASWGENDVGGIGVAASYEKIGTDSKAYIIYNVQPGTIFSANYLLNAADKVNYEKAEPTCDFEFVFSGSKTADGEYIELAKTNTTETSGYQIKDIDFAVPANVEFIKIEFPTTGVPWEELYKVDLNGNGVVGTDHNEGRLSYGNHCVFIRKVSYVPFGTEVEEEIVVKPNDYVAKGEAVLDDEVKTAFDIYNYNEVIGTANGIVADTDAENAYVEYKVSNETALVIGTKNNLKIAVSYDGKNFVNAELTNYANAYTLNLVDGKQYVRVYLGEGDAITSVTAKHLTPTVTFVNYAGTEEKFDVAYGGSATATLNTSRVGYTFSNWNKAATDIYVDTVIEAIYAKDTAKTYTVAFATGSEGEIATPDGIAANALRFDDRVTVTAPASYTDDNTTVVFDKWVDANGKTVSNSHKFSFLVSGDITLEAVYAESKSDIDPFIYNSGATITDNGDKWNMSVVWTVNAPANVKVTETGIVLAATETTMELGAANTVTMKHSTAAAGKALMYTVNNIADGKTRYARPYAVLSNGTTIYGTTVVATDAQ